MIKTELDFSSVSWSSYKYWNVTSVSLLQGWECEHRELPPRFHSCFWVNVRQYRRYCRVYRSSDSCWICKYIASSAGESPCHRLQTRESRSLKWFHKWMHLVITDRDQFYSDIYFAVLKSSKNDKLFWRSVSCLFETIISLDSRQHEWLMVSLNCLNLYCYNNLEGEHSSFFSKRGNEWWTA